MTKEQVEIIKFRLNKSFEELKVANFGYENKLFNASIAASYYVIFNAARALLAAENLSSKTHSGVIHLFSNNFVKKGILEEKYNRILSSAFLKRNECDYADLFFAAETDTHKQLEDAKDFLQVTLIILGQNYQLTLSDEWNLFK